MHYAGILGQRMHQDAEKFGWKIDGATLKHDWEKLVDTVQNHVRSLNFSYRSGLRSANVEYINAHATFKNKNTLEYTLRGTPKELEAENILIAVGGRPLIPSEIPGAKEYAISSDDIFSKETPPGKTLVVGASYIALECAGFLTELGFDTTVAVRSILLRGFDRDAADKIEQIMRCNGTKFVNKLPAEITKKDMVDDESSPQELTVKFSDGSVENYNTVLYATGRYPDTSVLNLQNAGVQALKNHKFQVNDNEQTNIDNIYAIGDILQGRPELTPVAIKTGELLARRLFGNSTIKMNWDLIPTTVFTPVEYGTIGLSEADAISRYGDENIRTYLSEFTGLEQGAAHRTKVESERADEFDVDMPPTSFVKLVTLKNENEKVIGFHYVGDNAGEITQGYAVALKCGATMSDFRDTMSIHPTDAEAVIQISVTRESGESWTAAGGCGGGKCG
jgi:thioredoxin reductase (NADPH)